MTPLTKWVSERPQATLERLRKINLAATSSAHIILALSYGLQDPHVRAINKMIITMLLARRRAQRSGNVAAENRIEEKLQCLHEAIDLATGTCTGGGAGSHTNGTACKRPTRYSARQPV